MSTRFPMGIDSEQIDIHNLFMPKNSSDTRYLVGQSGEMLAKSVASVLTKFWQMSIFEQADPLLSIAIDRLADIGARDRQRWLASPLLRAWVGRLSDAMLSLEPAKVILKTLQEIPNYFINPELFEKYPPVIRQGIIETADVMVRFVSQHRQSHTSDFCLGDFTLESVHPIIGTQIVIRDDLTTLRVAIDQSCAPQREKAVIGTGVPWGDPAYPPPDGVTLNQAVQWLSDAWPEELHDWKETLQVIVPFQLTGKWSANSFTISSMQGACWSTQVNTLLAYESLVHEQSHIKLRYIEDSYPLLAKGQSNQKYPVGWRSDMRPIIGIFEGVYVHIHIAHALIRLLETNLLTEPDRCTCRQRLNEVVMHIAEGTQLLSKNARWTSFGDQFLNWASAEKESLLKTIL